MSEKLIVAMILLPIVYLLFPGAMPFGLFEFWHIKEGGPLDWIVAAWPVFAWGIGLATITCLLSRNEHEVNERAEGIFARGTLKSVLAGFAEEITFRWVLFLYAIVAAMVVNHIFFGFLGFGILEALQVHLIGPVANFFTLGFLESYLVNPTSWAIGAGVLSANSVFRDCHRYLGILGFLNSWFMGMFLFFILFQYGLIACILVHFLYDFLIDIIRYADMIIERKLGLGVAPEEATLLEIWEED